jgi:hypothetical protein
MTTRITRIQQEATNRMLLKLEGSLSLADASLVEDICIDLGEGLGYEITVDLTDVAYVSKESATVLCRLKSMPGFDMQGMHLFVQQIIELAETAAANGNGKDGRS